MDFAGPRWRPSICIEVPLRIPALAPALAVCFLVLSCNERQSAAEPLCSAPAVRTVVTRLGERLQRASTLAPDSLVRRAISNAYADLVTPDLLDTWIATPSAAPGRDVSSPWPARIDIAAVDPVHLTNAEWRGTSST